jgi:hypothetical protein
VDVGLERIYHDVDDWTTVGSEDPSSGSVLKYGPDIIGYENSEFFSLAACGKTLMPSRGSVVTTRNLLTTMSRLPPSLPVQITRRFPTAPCSTTNCPRRGRISPLVSLSATHYFSRSFRSVGGSRRSGHWCSLRIYAIPFIAPHTVMIKLVVSLALF